MAEVLEIDEDEIWKPGNQPLQVKARSLTCFWAVRELGMSGTNVGKLPGLGQPAVSRAVMRGEKISRDMNIKAYTGSAQGESLPYSLFVPK